MKERLEVGECIHEYVASVDRNARHKTKRVHTDNAAELVAMRKGLAKIGVESATSTDCNPRSNKLDKSTNRSLIDKTLPY